MYLKLHFNVLAQDLQPTMRINTKKKEEEEGVHECLIK